MRPAGGGARFLQPDGKMESPNAVFRFGPYELRPRLRELYKHGVRLKIRPQPAQVLHTLLTHAGEVVTREQLRGELWSSETFVDFEHSLNTAVKELRSILGDAAAEPRYIETLPRLGYRFVAAVEASEKEDRLTGAGVVRREPIPGAAMRASKADVTSPTVAPKASETGVAGPVEGSVPVDRSGATAAAEIRGRRRRRAAFWLSLVLIAALGVYVGRNAFRTHFRLQNAAAAKISGEKPDGAAAAPSTEARDFYLKGMYLWNRRTPAGFEQAIDNFQQATRIDPKYAPAYAGLANSYTLLTAYSSSAANVYMPQARAAAARALELDPKLAEGHAAMALIIQNHDWDWQTSEQEYRRAIELNPNYATAHQWYAEHLMWLGRFDEAMEESRKAQQLDPLSMIIAADQGAILYYSRQYDQAIEQLRSVFRRDPTFQRAEIIINAYVEKRMFARALSEARGNGIYGHGQWSWAMSAYIYGRAGEFEKARSELNKLEQLGTEEQLKPAVQVWAHLGLGDKEGALADLEKAYAQQSNIMTTLRVEPAFDPIRGDPRFQDLLRRVHLAR